MNQQPSRRKFLATAGAGAAALGIAACSNAPSAPGSSNANTSKDAAGAMKTYGVGKQFKATEPLTFSILMLSNPAYPYKANWLFFQDLKKMTNVSLNATVVNYADYSTKQAALINAGNAPLIIPKTYPGQEDQFVAGGAILPVSDYVHLMPNFQDKVAKWNLQGDIDTLRQSDGKYYLLPGLHQQVWVDYTMGVRSDLLDKLGIPTPGTLTDVENMLLKVKAKYPQMTPFSDRWNQPTPGGAFQLEPTMDWAGIHPNAKTKINVTYGFFNGVFAYGGSTQLLDTQFGPAELAFQKIMNTRTPLPVNPPAPLSTLQSQQATLTGTTLMSYVQQQTLQFITGKRPLSQWSQFQGELKTKNVDQFLNIYNTAYQSYNKKFG